ncbi:hypothetical protein V6N11_030685 [Hibiscus sabdariffa]|uniref:Uncharacterized protein n=1 Tax=Hibiscus sabdariffa TaxID=183260 RepID=A0ABR1ZQ27_9ROSI
MLMERLGPIKPAPVRCLRDAMGNWLFVFSPCLEIGLETDLVVDNVTVIEILHDWGREVEAFEAISLSSEIDGMSTEPWLWRRDD